MACSFIFIYMEYPIIYDVRYFTVHIFNGSENTIFISLTCDAFDACNTFHNDALIRTLTY